MGSVISIWPELQVSLLWEQVIPFMLTWAPCGTPRTHAVGAKLESSGSMKWTQRSPLMSPCTVKEPMSYRALPRARLRRADLAEMLRPSHAHAAVGLRLVLLTLIAALRDREDAAAKIDVGPVIAIDIPIGLPDSGSRAHFVDTLLLRVSSDRGVAFSDRGLVVLKSELRWLWLPLFAFAALTILRSAYCQIRGRALGSTGVK
jgi:hypothetical protein